MLQLLVEIAHYLASPSPAVYDVLKYWKGNSAVGVYPLLCQLARVHLAAAASSVPVESMFSTTGLIANSRRSSLSADKLHQITFIHDNFDIAF